MGILMQKCIFEEMESINISFGAYQGRTATAEEGFLMRWAPTDLEEAELQASFRHCHREDSCSKAGEEG